MASTVSTNSDTLPGWTESRVQEIMERGLQPLRADMKAIRSDMEEIKSTISVVRDLIKELVHRNNSSQEPGSQRPPLKNLSKPVEVGVSVEDTAPQHPTPRQEGQQQSSQRTGLPRHREDTEEGIGSVRRQSSVEAVSRTQKSQPDPDLGGELAWFKGQVDLLQKEVQSLENRQEAILMAVKVHCDATQGIIRGYSNALHEIKDSSIDTSLEEKLKETVSKILKDSLLHHAASANEVLIEGALENLHALTMGQSQRIIDKIRNPSPGNNYVFHFYIPQFEHFIGSGQNAHSLLWTVDFMQTFMIIRGVASFPAEGSHMTVELEHIIDAFQLGLDQGEVSQINVKARIKAQESSAMEDIELGEVAVSCGGNRPHTDDSRLFRLNKPIQSCEQLVQGGYNSFKNMSLLIEFEISDLTEQRSLFSALKAAMPSSLR